VLSTLAAPLGGGRPDNSAVVTSDVKSLDASLSRLKAQVDGSRAEEARAEVARIDNLWPSLRPGLSIRNLQAEPSIAGFEAALADMTAASLQDRAAAGQAQRSLAAAFAGVKADLQATTTVDAGRLVPTAGIVLLALVSLVVVIPRVSDRLRLAQ
jgi:hypothetical protein